MSKIAEAIDFVRGRAETNPVAYEEKVRIAVEARFEHEQLLARMKELESIVKEQHELLGTTDDDEAAVRMGRVLLERFKGHLKGEVESCTLLERKVLDALSRLPPPQVQEIGRMLVNIGADRDANVEKFGAALYVWAEGRTLKGDKKLERMTFRAFEAHVRSLASRFMGALKEDKQIDAWLEAFGLMTACSNLALEMFLKQQYDEQLAHQLTMLRTEGRFDFEPEKT